MMKKILSIILCVLMILPCFLVGISAEEETEEPQLENLALNASLQASSTWNDSTPAKATINNNTKNNMKESYHDHFWQPNAPPGDPNADPNLHFIRYSFRGPNKGYKLIDDVVLYVRKNSCLSNAKYTLKVLLFGEWVTIQSVDDVDIPYVSKDEFDYDYGNRYGKLTFTVPETVTIDDEEYPVNTTSIKIEIENVGAGEGGCGHWWDLPGIYQTVIMGETGFVPEFDVPVGAILSTNAALSGLASASSSPINKFPALAIDNKYDTSWASKKTTDGEWIMTEFDKAYNLASLELDFGGMDAEKSYEFDVDFRIDGTWVTAGSGSVKTSTTKDDPKSRVEIPLESSTSSNVDAVRITFTKTNGVAASITEIIATIADGDKCIFLNEFMTAERKQSLANGNVAIYGTPYASSVFDHLGISDVSFINDGGISYGSSAWYASGFITNQYCGVTLDRKFKVNKVVLYFEDIIASDTPTGYFSLPEDNIKGDYVLGFDVQVKNSKGKYETVASGTSFNVKTNEHTVSFEFDEVVTDDVRVLFTQTDAGFAYIKELEIYADEKYDGYSTMPHGRKIPAVTTDFGKLTVTKRANWIDTISPLCQFASAKFDIVDIRASLWI